jgi:GntR family transcriptional regulator, transcriptional repressor for pyruvate dehydrogenase complex
MGAPLTEAAIARIRDLIVTGRLRPGDRLPPEQQLSEELGLSRSSTREAVRALVTSRVLDVRRGDGTYVTSLSPQHLLEGIGFAMELTQEESLVELAEARRVLEGPVTALAARRATSEELDAVETHLGHMRATDDPEEFVKHDQAFHAAIAHASGNGTLASMLIGISKVTVRARVFRGATSRDATERTLKEHQAILDALRAGNVELAHATATVHVASIEAWLRSVLDAPAAQTGSAAPLDGIAPNAAIEQVPAAMDGA